MKNGDLTQYHDRVKVLERQIIRQNQKIAELTATNEALRRERGKGSFESKRFPVLQVTKTIEQEVFLWHYDETPRDRRYIRYCNRLGRDYPRKKIWDKTEELTVDEDQLILWLREVINLRPDMAERILALFKKDSPQSIESLGPQDT